MFRRLLYLRPDSSPKMQIENVLRKANIVDVAGYTKIIVVDLLNRLFLVRRPAYQFFFINFVPNYLRSFGPDRQTDNRQTNWDECLTSLLVRVLCILELLLIRCHFFTLELFTQSELESFIYLMCTV